MAGCVGEMQLQLHLGMLERTSALLEQVPALAWPLPSAGSIQLCKDSPARVSILVHSLYETCC